MKTVPESIPGSVIYAIVDVMQAIETEKFLQSLDPRTQSYNQAWSILPVQPASDNSQAVVKKAQILALENGWDWDGIVAKALAKQTLIDPRKVKCLQNLDVIWHENDCKQAAFSLAMGADC